MPRYGIAGSLGTSVFSFSKTSIMFCLVGVLTYIPPSSVGGFPFPHTLCRLYCCRVFGVAILINVRWYPIVHLICLSLRTSDTEHRFMCFMAISMTSLGKCAFRYLDNFLLGVFLFCFVLLWRNLGGLTKYRFIYSYPMRVCIINYYYSELL